MRKMVTLLLFLFPMGLMGQDSKDEIEILFSKFRNNMNNLDSAEYYIKSAYNHSMIYEDSNLFARAIDYQGWILWRQGKYDESLTWYRKALKISRETHFIDREAIVLNHIYNSHISLGSYDSALFYAFSNLEVRNEIGDTAKIAVAFSNLARVYYELNNKKESLYYYKVTLDYLTNSKDTTFIVDTHSNIISSYYSLGNYDLIEYHLQIISRLCRNGCPKTAVKRLNYYRGINNYRLKNYSDAISSLMSALAIAEEENDKYLSSYSNLFLAKVYRKMNFDKEYNDRVSSSLEIAINSNLTEILLDIYLEMSDYYSDNENSNLALYNLKKHLELSDSIRGTKVFWNVDKIHAEQIDKKNNQILEQKEEAINQQTRANLYLKISGALSLLIIFGMIYNAFSIRKKNRTIQLQNEELDIYNGRLVKGLDERDMELQSTRDAIERVISRISHDVRGKVATLKLLSYLAEKENDEEDEYYSKITETIKDTDKTLAWLTAFSRIKNQDLNIQEFDLELFIRSSFPELDLHTPGDIRLVSDQRYLYDMIESFDDWGRINQINIDSVIEGISIYLSLNRKFTKTIFRKWQKYLNSEEDINADVDEIIIRNRAAIERLGGSIAVKKHKDEKNPHIILHLPSTHPKSILSGNDIT